MARAPTAFDIYRQPAAEYKILVPWFAQSKVQIPYASGFKLHISVAMTHHDQLAHGLLPTLRERQTPHKVILPGQYAPFTRRYPTQAGKFITIYAGPEDPAQDIVDTIDPILLSLREQGVQPGPPPWSRQSIPRNERGVAIEGAPPTQREMPIGQSGMISWLWRNNLTAPEQPE